MPNPVLVSSLVLALCGVVVLGVKLINAQRMPKVSGKLEEFKTTLALVEFFCGRTFDLYFQLQINPSLLINEPFEEKEYDQMRKDFYKMVTEQMGQELINLAIFYFGDKRSFVRFIASYFEDRLISARTMKTVYGYGHDKVRPTANGLHAGDPEQQRREIRNYKE